MMIYSSYSPSGWARWRGRSRRSILYACIRRLGAAAPVPSGLPHCLPGKEGSEAQFGVIWHRSIVGRFGCCGPPTNRRPRRFQDFRCRRRICRATLALSFRRCSQIVVPVLASRAQALKAMAQQPLGSFVAGAVVVEGAHAPHGLRDPGEPAARLRRRACGRDDGKAFLTPPPAAGPVRSRRSPIRPDRPLRLLQAHRGGTRPHPWPIPAPCR